ncbi:hypothetical protein T05_4374 [Trichinella murrelli]|uniref:Uncharacterized protein n=1 Tax=Trichinella murrelli TaxID=144512 RepID=A0A0V0T7B5_9BILA|nr:hypothetical protein T05_4374 [Trichinella murrelli]
MSLSYILYQIVAGFGPIRWYDMENQYDKDFTV